VTPLETNSDFWIKSLQQKEQHQYTTTSAILVSLLLLHQIAVMASTSARRRFVSITLRNSQPAAIGNASASATATMRTAAAATHRSICTSDSGWFRTAANAAASLEANKVVPNASSALISTSIRRYGASKNSLLFQYKGQPLETMHSFSKLPYSTTVPVAAISEAETATGAESPVQGTATQQWRDILFGGLLAVTLTATLVLGFPQTAQATAPPATAEPSVTATSSSNSSSSNGSPHVTFRPSPKSTSSGNNNGDESGGGSAVMLSTQPLGKATSKKKNNAKILPRPVSNSGRAPYDVSVSTPGLTGISFISLLLHSEKRMQNLLTLFLL
jgi:hypothetical protein